MIYLNFDADWRRAFSAALRRGDRGLLGPTPTTPRRLQAGSCASGAGSSSAPARHGPTIELSTAGLIEVLDEPDPAAAAARPLPGRAHQSSLEQTRRAPEPRSKTARPRRDRAVI